MELRRREGYLARGAHDLAFREVAVAHNRARAGGGPRVFPLFHRLRQTRLDDLPGAPANEIVLPEAHSRRPRERFSLRLNDFHYRGSGSGYDNQILGGNPHRCNSCWWKAVHQIRTLALDSAIDISDSPVRESG